MALAKSDYLTIEDELKHINAYLNEGDEKSLKILIDNHADLVFSLARKKSRYNSIDFDDLVQEGMMGLVEAIKRFDVDSGNRLITYAKFYIDNHMFEYILRNCTLIRFAPSTYNRKIFFNIGRYRDSNGHMNHAAINRMAEELNVPVKNVIDMHTHLSATFYDVEAHDSDGDLETVTVADSYYDPAVVYERNNKLSFVDTTLKSSLESFDDRMADIVRQRFLQDDPTSLETLASKYGVSHQRIKQIEVDAVNKLKQNFERGDHIRA